MSMHVEKLVWLDYLVFLQKLMREADKLAKEEKSKVITAEILLQAEKSVLEETGELEG